MSVVDALGRVFQFTMPAGNVDVELVEGGLEGDGQASAGNVAADSVGIIAIDSTSNTIAGGSSIGMTTTVLLLLR